MTQPRTLAERKRQLVRDELAGAALRLLATQGFDATTIDQITATAGVSRRTFFRYFGSKEDVVVQLLAGLGAQMCAQLSERSPREAPAEALRCTFIEFVRAYCQDSAKAHALSRLVFHTPALRARYLEHVDAWRSGFTAEIARRSGAVPGDLRPAVTVAVALAAFDAAMTQWADGDSTGSLADAVEEAFRLVSPVLG
jgi:AcrR family transcriptional regulator